MHVSCRPQWSRCTAGCQERHLCGHGFGIAMLLTVAINDAEGGSPANCCTAARSWIYGTIPCHQSLLIARMLYTLSTVLSGCQNALYPVISLISCQNTLYSVTVLIACQTAVLWWCLASFAVMQSWNLHCKFHSGSLHLPRLTVVILIVWMEQV